jgi:hypothetical protein
MVNVSNPPRVIAADGHEQHALQHGRPEGRREAMHRQRTHRGGDVHGARAVTLDVQCGGGEVLCGRAPCLKPHVHRLEAVQVAPFIQKAAIQSVRNARSRSALSAMATIAMKRRWRKGRGWERTAPSRQRACPRFSYPPPRDSYVRCALAPGWCGTVEGASSPHSPTAHVATARLCCKMQWRPPPDRKAPTPHETPGGSRKNSISIQKD